jgi:type IV pilus assembly protein PilF
MKFLPLILALFLTSCVSSPEKTDKAALHMKIGISHFENANYPKALSAFLEAEQLDPQNALVQNNLGLTYFMRERFDLSEKHFKKAVSLKPTFTEARNNYARLLIEIEKYPQAEAELEKVLGDLTYGGFEKAYINLGLSHFKQKRFPKAVEAFLKAIDQQQDSCIANTYYGRSLLEMSEYQRALVALNRAISFCQKIMYDEPHYFSALTYYRLGEKEKSLARFEELVKLYPNGAYQEKSKAMSDLIRKGVE